MCRVKGLGSEGIKLFRTVNLISINSNIYPLSQWAILDNLNVVAIRLEDMAICEIKVLLSCNAEISRSIPEGSVSFCVIKYELQPTQLTFVHDGREA